MYPLKLIYAMTKPTCGFCISLGIEGPHDHWMRMRTNGDYKTICPNLLQTVCQSCFKKGHTSKYCTKSTIVKEKNNLDKIINNPNPRPKYEPMKKEKKIANMWSALCIESDSSDDEDNVLDMVANFIKKPYIYMNWADVDTDDDEIPPLPASWKIKSR